MAHETCPPRRGRRLLSTGVAVGGAAALALPVLAAGASGPGGIGQGTGLHTAIPTNLSLTIQDGNGQETQQDFPLLLNFTRGPKLGVHYAGSFGGGGVVPPGTDGAGSVAGLSGIFRIMWDSSGDSALLGAKQLVVSFTKVGQATGPAPGIPVGTANAPPLQLSTAGAVLAGSPDLIQRAVSTDSGVPRIDSRVPIDSEPFNKPLPVPRQALAGDHYKCYRVIRTRRTVRTVRLRDQFGNSTVRVVQPFEVCNPVGKIHRGRTTGIRDTRRHLVKYVIKADRSPSEVSAQNQFGNHLVTAGDLTRLLVPSQKQLVLGRRSHLPRRSSTRVLDHFACYQASGRRTARRTTVALFDQFERKRHRLAPIDAICNPTRKTVGRRITRVRNPQAHLTSYKLSNTRSPRRIVRIANQFGSNQLVVTKDATSILVPSGKRLCARFRAGPPINSPTPGEPPGIAIRSTQPPPAGQLQRQELARITGVELTPYDGDPKGACPAT